MQSPTLIIDGFRNARGSFGDYARFSIDGRMNEMNVDDITRTNYNIMAKVASDEHFFMDNKNLILKGLQSQAFKIQENLHKMIHGDDLCAHVIRNGFKINSKKKHVRTCLQKIRHPMLCLESLLKFYNERGLLDASYCNTIIILTGYKHYVQEDDKHEEEEEEEVEVEDIDVLQRDVYEY